VLLTLSRWYARAASGSGDLAFSAAFNRKVSDFESYSTVCLIVYSLGRSAAPPAWVCSADQMTSVCCDRFSSLLVITKGGGSPGAIFGQTSRQSSQAVMASQKTTITRVMLRGGISA